MRSDLLIKLYVCRVISGRLTAALLDAQIEARRAYLERLTALAAEAAPGGFERLVRDSKLGAARATLDWLAEKRTRLGG